MVWLEKKGKEKIKQSTVKKAFWLQKLQADDVRKQKRETWLIKDISNLLTYKRQKNDCTIKSNKKNRMLMLQEWDKRSSRPTPPCSPMVNIGNGDVAYVI
jgi:hypothetical protein